MRVNPEILYEAREKPFTPGLSSFETGVCTSFLDSQDTLGAFN